MNLATEVLSNRAKLWLFTRSRELPGDLCPRPLRLESSEVKGGPKRN